MAAAGGVGLSRTECPRAWLRRGRGRLVYTTYWLATLLAPRVPAWLAYRCCDLIGDLALRLNRPGRRAAERNLTRILGHQAPAALVRLLFRNSARDYYETLLMPSLRRTDVIERVDVSGFEQLDRALAAGRGAIVATMHLGNAPVSGQFIPAHGYPVTTVAEPIEPPELLGLMLRLRGAGGARVVPIGPRLIVELLGCLARNEVVVLLLDRDVAGTGVEVELCGAPVRLPGGAALLALRTGAPIIPAFTARQADGRFIAWFEEPVPLERNGSLRENVRGTTQHIARRFETQLRRYPEQWTVFKDVWTEAARGEGGKQP